MIGTETTLTRLFSLEVTEFELRILFNSLTMLLNTKSVHIDGPEGHEMRATMQKLLDGE